MTRDEFIKDISGWSSYLPLLFQALESTEGEVVELGMGHGSTPKLHQYCYEAKRMLTSYDSDIEWYRKFEHLRKSGHAIEYTQNWLEPIQTFKYKIGVLFSDEAPGFVRKYNIAMFSQSAQIIVVHDTEQSSDHGYLFSLLEDHHLFKYKKDYVFEKIGARAYSNFVDVSKWEL